jgi:hypothetical protein
MRVMFAPEVKVYVWDLTQMFTGLALHFKAPISVASDDLFI